MFMILILYAVSLQVVWVVYFKSETRELEDGKLLEGSKVCCH